MNQVLIVPFGAGTENTTFSMRIIGWRVAGRGMAALWIPVVLAEIACTLSATVGVAGKEAVATDRFVDTITLVTGTQNVSMELVSPTGDEIGHVLVDIKGFQKLELSYDMTGATNGNALLAFL
jgi:hypothetical protein